jgi:hypothetical protein
MQNSDAMYFVVDKSYAICCLDLGSLCLSVCSDADVDCLHCEQLIDYYPLAHYKRGSLSHVVLHHAICSAKYGNY